MMELATTLTPMMTMMVGVMLDEQACERKEWNSRQIFGGNYGYDYAYPSGIVWLPNNDEMQFQTVGIGISSEYIRMGGH